MTVEDLTRPPTLVDASAFVADAREALMAAVHKLDHAEMVLSVLRAEALQLKAKESSCPKA